MINIFKEKSNRENEAEERSKSYYDVVSSIREAIGETIYFSDELTDETVKSIIADGVRQYASKNKLVYNQDDIAKDVFNILRRLDVIEPLVNDGEITEIMVNGYDNIFVEKKGEVYKTDIRFCNENDLENLIQRIVSSVNRSVNQSHPIVDARLENGARVNVVLPPISLDGPILTIRKFPEKPMDTNDLIECQSITPEAAEFLKKLVLSKHNIFISGGTGSGKTTFLNVLSSYIPYDERIITIEDSAELQLTDRENLVRMEKRNANGEGVGEVDIRNLIKTSLRMRPDRMIVGEVRGEEAIDMLQSMNTGHDGSLSTGHANSAVDMISRLETMVITASNIPLSAIQNQISTALDYIIHLSRLRDKTRRTMEISEFLGYRNNQPILNPIFSFVEKGCENGKVIGTLERTENKIVNKSKFEHFGIAID